MSPQEYYMLNKNTTGLAEFPPWLLASEPCTIARSAQPRRSLGAGTSASVPIVVEREEQAVSVETRVIPVALEAKRRWEEIKRRNWPEKWREERIARGLAALNEAIVDYGLDADTVRWIAEEATLEDV